jgi:NCS1 family nucleobase:cation symporter-1
LVHEEEAFASVANAWLVIASLFAFVPVEVVRLTETASQPAAAEASLYRDEVLRVEPHAVEPIEARERHGRPGHVFTLWVGANVEFATLTTGALAVGLFGLGFRQAALALILGNLVGGLILGALTTFGPRLGLPQLIHSRSAFGFAGNYVPAALNFIAGVGWFAVNTVLGVFALMWLLQAAFVPCLLIVAVLQVVFAVYGYNLIHAFERWMAALLTLIFAAVTVVALGHIHFATAANVKAPLWSGVAGSFILAFGVAFSYVLGWVAFASDYTRYLPAETPPRRVFRPAFWGVALSCIWLEVLGAGLATALPHLDVPTDLVTGFLPHPLAVLAMLAVVLGTMTANVLNIYSGSLSVLAIDVAPVRALFPRRWVAVLILGTLGTVLSLAGQHGYYARYTDFLLLLAYWVAPWSAVVLVDYFLVRRGNYRTAEFYDRRRGVGPGLPAWALGVLASVPFFNQSLYTGPIAKAAPQLGDISYYVGFLVAGAVYYAAASRRRAPAVGAAAAD